MFSVLKNHIKLIIAAIAVIIILLNITVAMIFNGVILLNNPSAEKYPVRGVDVSSYQGKIDWQVLAAQDIQFAYIKATEGSAYVDTKFAYNWENASASDLYIGAYHFFSYDSEGKTQAENFIANVPVRQNSLPPVVDVEFYGDKEKNPPAKEEVTRELQAMLDILEEHYGKRPIIYATNKSYQMYIERDFDNYDIWIRDVIFKPSSDYWTFWQFTNRMKLDGYDGKEKFIDMNVFRGTFDEFEKYVK